MKKKKVKKQYYVILEFYTKAKVIKATSKRQAKELFIMQLQRGGLNKLVNKRNSSVEIEPNIL